MEWIQGVTWAANGVFLRTVDGNQDELLRPTHDLQSIVAWAETSMTKIRGRTSFSDWRALSPSEVAPLAHELGYPGRLTSQAFYAFQVDRLRYILPAAGLMCAMFRPFHGIAKYLFAPQGLDNLCMPHGNSEKPELMFFVPPRKATGMQTDKAQGIANSLSWMQCFPSARQMWASVLEQAKEGRLDVTLPNGEIEYLGSGRPLASGDVLILELRIRILETTEEPFEPFSLHTRTIEFERILHKREDPRLKRTYPKDPTIPLRNGDWTLTDEEWAAVKGLLVLRARNDDPNQPRRFLNLQLHKLSQGLSWPMVTDCTAEQMACRNNLERVKADGRWEALIAKLTELRAA